MMRSGSPLPRPASPAISEISVGSPSPPLASGLYNLSQHNGLTAFRPLSLKRARLSEDIRQQSTVVTTDNGIPLTIRLPPQAPQRRKSNAERVKSFSIADILGKRDAATPQPGASRTPTPPAAIPQLLAPLEPAIAPLALLNTSGIAETPILPALPRPQPAPPATLLPTQIRGERLGPTIPPPSAPLIVPPTQLLLDAHTFPKWQAIRGAAAAAAVPMPLGPFLPPSLLHYEQRLAWDYQRQLQEHFQAQAQLLRQMSMDPSIIPSEDGSDHSHSSSTGSECCSPDLGAASIGLQCNEDKTCNKEASGNGRKGGETTEGDKAQNSPGDTPLDALFQLSTKNFDDGTDPSTLDIFSTRPNPKKKRKSRTAFTNHQIFELEKRFLYQKYLSPADRDEIAASLGLSNAQVITWFQNRRAKLKRDMEELKKDVDSVKQLSGHKSFLENVNDLSILKTRPVSRHQQPTISISMPAAFTAASAAFNGLTQQSAQFGASSSSSASTSSPYSPNIALIMPAIPIAHTTTTTTIPAAAAEATTTAQLPTQQQQQAQQRKLEAGAINVPIEIGGNNSARRSDSSISSNDSVDNEAANANQSRLHQLNSSRG